MKIPEEAERKSPLALLISDRNAYPKDDRPGPNPDVSMIRQGIPFPLSLIN